MPDLRCILADIMRILFRLLPFLFVGLIAFGGFLGCKKSDPQTTPGQDTTQPQDTTKPVDTTQPVDTTHPIAVDTNRPPVGSSEAQIVQWATRRFRNSRFLLSYHGWRQMLTDQNWYSNSGGTITKDSITSKLDTQLYNKTILYFGYTKVRSAGANDSAISMSLQTTQTLLSFNNWFVNVKGTDLSKAEFFFDRVFVNNANDSFVGLICPDRGLSINQPRPCLHGYYDYEHDMARHQNPALITSNNFTNYNAFYTANPSVKNVPSFGAEHFMEIQYYFNKDSLSVYNFTRYNYPGPIPHQNPVLKFVDEYNIMLGKRIR